MIDSMKPIICAELSTNLGPVIPGRHRQVANPESITSGKMDSGFAAFAAPRNDIKMIRISKTLNHATAPALSCIEQAEIDRFSHLEIADRRGMNAIAAVVGRV